MQLNIERMIARMREAWQAMIIGRHGASMKRKKNKMLSDKAMGIVVSAVAKAIHNSRKFNQAEQKQASGDIISAIQKDASLLAELGEMNEKISNVSQCSQDLAKAGVVSHGEPSAFARQVATAVEKMNTAVKNAEKKL